MKKDYPVEFVYQALSLIVALIVVHAFYVAVVRPRADTVLAEQTAQMQADPDYVQERSIWVIIRDFEQEACFVLALWALAIMALKGAQAAKERKLLQEDLVPVSEGTKILPEDAREYARQIQSLPASDQRALLAQGAAGSSRPFQRHSRHPERLDDVACGLRGGVREARVGALHGALHRLGHSLHRIPGYREGHRRGPGAGTQGGGGRHRRGHPEPRRGLQLHLHRAADQHRAHVSVASIAASPGTAGARHRDLSGPASDPHICRFKRPRRHCPGERYDHGCGRVERCRSRRGWCRSAMEGPESGVCAARWESNPRRQGSRQPSPSEAEMGREPILGPTRHRASWADPFPAS